MIYFDNAATTLPKPPSVIEAVTSAMQEYGNPSRGAYDASLNALRTLMACRRKIAALVECNNPQQVAFSYNATAALNTAIHSLPGDHIVTTAVEHNSVLRPVFRHGNFTIVPTDAQGNLDLDMLERAVTPETSAIVLCHASNVTGNAYDLTAVGEICKRRSVHFIVDGAQTAGLLPVDMENMHISAYCFSGHKSLYGPQGTGGIVLGNNFLPTPLIVGGSGSASFEKKHPAAMPDALEAGTQNAHGIAGLYEGLQYVESMQGQCYEKAMKLSKQFITGVQNINGVTIYGNLNLPVRTPVVSINCGQMDSAVTATLLYERYQIAVRAGAHCAPYMHKTLGTSQKGAVRFSFSHFNTEQEIQKAIDALTEICKLNETRANS